MSIKPFRRRALLAASLCATLLLPAIFAARTLFPPTHGDTPDEESQSLFAAQSKAAQSKALEKKPSATSGEDARSSAGDNSAGSERAGSERGGEMRDADVALGRAITRLIEEGELSRARWGVSVVSLRDGRVLYARDAQRLITPASNMKLFATAASLELLGADYRWRTSVYAASQPDAGGTLAGDLVLYGRGAPDLASRTGKDAPTNHLAALADALYRRGVRRVRGAIVGDESYFRGEALGDGWQWDDVQWYYGAELSALSVDQNEITLDLAPATKPDSAPQMRLVPSTEYVHITNDMRTVARGERSTLGVTRSLSSNEVRVWGDFPVGASSYSVRLSVHQPALWAAILFRDALRQRGIQVEGEARLRDARTRDASEFKPEEAVELAFVESKRLGEVVHETNKESLNLQAELLLRTLGRVRGDELAPMPDERRARARNTDAAGLAVERRWLEERAGVDTSELAFHDGSGLSRLNLVTPEAFTRLLARMSKSDAARAFRDSLPVAGRDGTLRNRLRNAGATPIAAKTGSLTYINSLSGYATTAQGEPLAFSIICDDETARASAIGIIDDIAALLASYPSKP